MVNPKRLLRCRGAPINGYNEAWDARSGMPRIGSTVQRVLVFSGAVLLVTSMAGGQSKQDPYRSNPQRANPQRPATPTSPKGASPTVVIAPDPRTSGKASSANQQLSTVERATNRTLTSPHKTAPAPAAPETKPADATAAKSALNFPYKAPKAAPATSRHQSPVSETGIRGRVSGTGK